MRYRADLDTYTGSDGQAHCRYRLGEFDTTPDVVTYPHDKATRRYHAECSGCYFGNLHSEAYHDSAEERYGEARRYGP